MNNTNGNGVDARSRTLLSNRIKYLNNRLHVHTNGVVCVETEGGVAPGLLAGLLPRALALGVKLV